MQKNAYDKFARFWVVRIQSTVWCNNRKTSIDMHFTGWYKGTSWLLHVILDGSVTANIIKCITLPEGWVHMVLSKPIKYQIIMDMFDSLYAVKMKLLIFTEYNKNKSIDGHTVYVLGDNHKYNIIWGRDFNARWIMIHKNLWMD